MAERIAVLDRDRCHPQKCARECIKFCPRVRTGDETIVMGEEGYPVISESLCVGCGICVRKCPFDAITIIGLPEELEEPVHRYGKNGFALYGLPIPREGMVTGILGPNGIGKTTAVQVLTGQLQPNLGREDATWQDVIEHYSGSALQDYLTRVTQGEIEYALKPQYVDAIPKAFQGKVGELLERTDERNELQAIIDRLNLRHLLDRDIDDLSGGELQQVAIAAAVARDADFYFFDEITPFLDINQRLEAARVIRELSEVRAVLVVEHDLAVLDLLADQVHVAYGSPGAYGVITHPKGVRIGINEYLRGYLPEENVRIRPETIEFETRAPKQAIQRPILLEYDEFTKSFNGFTFHTSGGELRKGEVTGIVGPNGIGKSTFIKLLAGALEPDEGSIDLGVKVAYKPQYLKADQSIPVRLFLRNITDKVDTSYYETRIIQPLRLKLLLDQNLTDLSGGELQRVAIAAALSQDADLYMLDEPSAHLDVEQRALAARAIRRFTEDHETTALIVDHDIYFLDLLSDRLMVFEGEPAVRGEAHGPYNMREGMNRFLRNLGITFRRDEETQRPRVNKPGSRLDRQQKKKGEYYYLPETSS